MTKEFDGLNPCGYFDRILCINLDSHTDRWEQAQAEFEKMGIAHRVERFSAIEDPEDPERGCYRSHVACANWAMEEDLDNVLIFEDDIKVLDTSEMAGVIHELSQTDWRLFYMGGYPSQRRVNIPTGARDFSKHLCQLRGGYLCGHAYAVHRSLFPAYCVATQPIDRWYAYKVQPKSLCLVAKKMIVGQQDGFSELRGKYRRRSFMSGWHKKMIRKAK